MVSKCINNAVRQGAIDAADGQRLINDFNAMIQAHTAGGAMNPAVAAALAQKTMAGQLRQNAALKQLRVIRQTEAQAKLASHLANANDVHTAINAIFTPDWRDRYTFTSLEYRTRYIEAQAKKFYSEAIANVQRKFTGEVTDTTEMNFYRELVGISTNDKWAKALAEGFKKSFAYLSDRYSIAGGAIKKAGNYDLKHVHSALRLREVTPDEWVNFTMPLLDRTKMIDDYTGLPLHDNKLRQMLTEMYHTISTNGYNKKTATHQGKASVANKYDQERVLHFKDDNWLTYNERFGEVDIVSTAIRQITDMSREIAQMETFGPNVGVGLDHLKTMAIQELQKRQAGPIDANVRKRLIHDENTLGGKIDEWFDVATGRAFGMSDPRNAKYGDNARGFLAAAQLGSAVLAAVGDFGTMGWTAGFNKLPLTSLMKNYMDGLFTGKSAGEIRVFAADLGLQIEHLQANMIADAMYGIETSKQIGTVMADKVMRWSGLTRHTDAGRVAFSVTMAQEVGRNFTKAFDQLGDELKRGLSHNGISGREWDIIRASTPITRDGIPHVNLAAIERMEATHPGAGEAAVKLSQYIQSETDKAIITAGWKFERTMQHLPFKGQMARFASMYKRYPVLMFYHHAGRVMSMFGEGNGMGGLGYMAGFAATMTMLGGVALTLKDLAAGRDPRSWDSKGFWMDAFFAGGAGGIVADYVRTAMDAARQNRTQDAISPILNATIGPVFGLANDVAGPWWSKVRTKLDGKTEMESWKAFAGELPKLTKYAPGSSLWYGRLAFDRYVEDNLQRMMNPKANQLFARQIENRKKYYGQRFFSRPGSNTLIERAPDIGSNGQ